jgi:hypothetical protein
MIVGLFKIYESKKMQLCFGVISNRLSWGKSPESGYGQPYLSSQSVHSSDGVILGYIRLHGVRLLQVGRVKLGLVMWGEVRLVYVMIR